MEAQLKTSELVENICVYADPSRTHTVALLLPARPALQRLTKLASDQPLSDPETTKQVG